MQIHDVFLPLQPSNSKSALVSALDKHPLLCGNGWLLQAVLVDEGSNIEYELDPVNPLDR